MLIGRHARTRKRAELPGHLVDRRFGHRISPIPRDERLGVCSIRVPICSSSCSSSKPSTSALVSLIVSTEAAAWAAKCGGRTLPRPNTDSQLFCRLDLGYGRRMDFAPPPFAVLDHTELKCNG